ncbi:MAG: DMT family transporter [Lachnospiraceae bacterium]|nr:DMT family transporter [Lachnospiraceae bacterium]
MNNKIKGALLTLSGGMCWGLSGSMGQYLFDRQGMDARWLVPIRLFLAGVILFIYCFFKYRDKLFGIWKTQRSAGLLLVYGLAGVSLCQYAYFRTIQLSTAGVGTILQDLSPVMILLASCVLMHRAPRVTEIASLVLAILGIFLIVTHGDFHSMSVSPHALATGILSAVCVTVYNILTTPLAQDYPVPVMQAWSFLMGGVMLGLIFRPWHIAYVPNAIGLFGIAFVVIVGNVMAFTLYISGVHSIGPNAGILYGFSEPVTAAIISTALLGSGFGIWDAIGFACIFLMLVLISISGKEN